MKIYHVELAKTGTSVSGGEVTMLNLIHFLIKQKKKNVLITTDNGRSVYEEMGLVENEFFEYVTINSYHTEKKHLFISYVKRLFLFNKIKKEIIRTIDREEDVLICHSDFFPNTIPSYILVKKFSKKTLWFFQMQAPNIFRGFAGQFTDQFTFPSFSDIHYSLNQFIFFVLVKKIKGFILTVNPYYSKLLSKKNADFYVIKKFGGTDIPQETDGQQNLGKKEFDMVFLGRFHLQKGLLEIPSILEIVLQTIPTAKLAIIGDGDTKIKNKLMEAIQSKNLENNIKVFGSMVGKNKTQILNKSKIFVFPSYFESFGIVVLEAMAQGLPVVAYNLPVFQVFKAGMIKVPILNNELFSSEIIKLLNDGSHYNKMSVSAKSFASTFSWEKTGEEIISIINKL